MPHLVDLTLVALRLLGLEPLLQLMLGLELPLRLWIFVTHGRSRLKVLRLRLEADDGGKIAGQNRAVPSYPRPDEEKGNREVARPHPFASVSSTRLAAISPKVAVTGAAVP